MCLGKRKTLANKTKSQRGSLPSYPRPGKITKFSMPPGTERDGSHTDLRVGGGHSFPEGRCCGRDGLPLGLHGVFLTAYWVFSLFILCLERKVYYTAVSLEVNMDLPPSLDIDTKFLCWLEHVNTTWRKEQIDIWMHGVFWNEFCLIRMVSIIAMVKWIKSATISENNTSLVKNGWYSWVR